MAYSFAQTPVYEATATFVVNPGTQITQTGDLLYSIDTLAGRTSLATTYSNILKSRTIIEAAITSLSLPMTVLEDYKINSVVLPDSNVILLQIQGPSPVLSANLANTIGTAGLAYVSGLQEVYELRRLDPAVVDPVPISPDHPTNIALSVIVGLVGGLAFVMLRQVLVQPRNELQMAVSPEPAREHEGKLPTEQKLGRNHDQYPIPAAVTLGDREGLKDQV